MTACPTPEQWEQAMLYLDDLYRLAEVQSDTMKATLSELKTLEAQMEKLVRSTEEMAALPQQAGRKKEKRRFRLPKLSLPEPPRPTLAWLWIIPVLAGLGILWYGLVTVWNNLIAPLLNLLK